MVSNLKLLTPSYENSNFYMSVIVFYQRTYKRQRNHTAELLFSPADSQLKVLLFLPLRKECVLSDQPSGLTHHICGLSFRVPPVFGVAFVPSVIRARLAKEKRQFSLLEVKAAF